ncbi:MAG TPA: GIY-YIG nuclease family protein [Anaerolineales bacterium]|nr:GIY-YIG nuclease family protein [Anaerolineales bacterium]
MLECADGSFYTGWTTDPERRLKDHNAGRGSRYTRNRRPVRLVHVESQASPSEAMKRERAIKRMTRSRKLELVSKPIVSSASRRRREPPRRGSVREKR